MRRRKRQRRAVKRGGRQPRRLAVQPLEARRLMAADIGIFDGWVHIQGTDQSDIVESYFEGGQIVVSATQRNDAGLTIDKSDATFDAAEVQGLFFEGHAGDDVFVNDTDLPVVARGGPGNDTLLGNSANDVLTGGDDNDFIAAGAAGAVLLGGAGDNVLFEVETPAAEPLAPSGEATDAPADEEGICLDTPEWATEALTGAADEADTDTAEPSATSDDSAADEALVSDSDADADAVAEEDDPASPESNPTDVADPTDETESADDAAESNAEDAPIGDAPPVEDAGSDTGDAVAAETTDPAPPELVPIDVADEVDGAELPGDCDLPVETPSDTGETGETGETVDATSESSESDAPIDESGDSEFLAPVDPVASEPGSDAVAEDASSDAADETDGAPEESALVDTPPIGEAPSDNDFIVGGAGDDQIFGGDGNDWLVGYQLDDATLSDVLFGVLDAAAQRA